MPEAEHFEVALRLVIHGRVQGVAYRATTADMARQLALDGWVRNRLDGTVEAVIHGPRPTVDQFLAWARKGPPQARVTRIDSETCDPPEPGFEVLPTR
ncbi:MAG: acylphosphatase [Zoogloeaceae bacterium]|nr:acylphosphatase [Zoogloeaceae bacterium]